MTPERIDFDAECPDWCDDPDHRPGIHRHIIQVPTEGGLEHVGVGLEQVGDLPTILTIASPDGAFCSIAEAQQIRDTLDTLIRLAGDR